MERKTKLGLTILISSEATLETISGHILYTADESQKRQEWRSLGLLSK